MYRLLARRHLAGMGILALLHMVPIFVNVAYPGHAHKEININVVSVAILLRCVTLYILIDSLILGCPASSVSASLKEIWSYLNQITSE